MMEGDSEENIAEMIPGWAFSARGKYDGEEIRSQPVLLTRERI